MKKKHAMENAKLPPEHEEGKQRQRESENEPNRGVEGTDRMLQEYSEAGTEELSRKDLSSAM